MYITEPKLLFIGIIDIPLETLETIVTNIMWPKRTTKIVDSKTFSQFQKQCRNHDTFDKKPKVSLEGKVYLETYYRHMLGQVQINKTPAKVQIQELQIMGWTLTEKQQLL